MTALTSWFQSSGEDQSDAVTEKMTTMTVSTLATAGQKPFDFGLLFRAVIVIIGFVGVLANGTVLTALAASKEIKKELFNVLFVNQVSFDLYSSVMLIVTFFMKIFPRVHMSGTLGYVLCSLFYGETILWFGLNGSMLNLAAITVERYVKIVFPIWYKSKFRPWMVYSVPRIILACVCSFPRVSKAISRYHDPGITLVCFEDVKSLLVSSSVSHVSQ